MNPQKQAFNQGVEIEMKIKKDKQEREQDKIKSDWDYLNKELGLRWIEV